jgi:large subunit ribosomal protein L31e
VKEFLARHFRVENRDLKNVRLDKFLNEFLWARGIKNPPHKVKVKAVKEGDLVKAELVDYPTKLKFKKARLEKAAKAQEDLKSKKKTEEKAVADAAKKESTKESLEEKTKKEGDKKEEKEKKTSVVEAGESRAKSEHKAEKHQTQAKAQKSKRPVRQAMQK